jgi:signal transduction histidine kinase
MALHRKLRNYRWMLVAALCVAVLNAALAAGALRTLFDAEHWLVAVSAVSDASEQLAIANGAVRGFLLTGEPLYLQRYQDARQLLDQTVAKLSSVMADNNSQQRIVLLRQRLNVSFTAIDLAVAMRKGHGGMTLPDSILVPALSASPDGQVSPRYVLTQIDNEEQRLLEQREQQAKAAHTQVIVTALLASFFDIVLLIAAFELLRRAAISRDALATSAAHVTALNTELTGLNAELEARVEQRTRELAVSNQELEAFSYSVSHDLRAPLRTIDGFSLALEEDFADKLDAEGRDYISRVRAGVQRMGSLIDALLQLSRVTRSESTREQVDVSAVVTGVLAELQAASPERNVETVVQPGVTAEADGRLMRIALENLVGNAWKYSSRKEAAKVEFGTLRRDAEVVYFVRDNGAGFDMKYVDRLFTAFQRLHGDRDFKGSGIGLATVSRIIRRHHGEIWAEGTPEQGATFYFTLGEQLL